MNDIAGEQNQSSTCAGLVLLVGQLAALGGAGDSDHERLDQLAALERVKAAVAAAQARITVAFDKSQQQQARTAMADARAAGGEGFEAWRAARRRAAGVGAQVGLARGLSPWQGATALTFATALVTDLPGTLAALGTGVLSEWRATLIARETSHLSAADRMLVDREIHADPQALAGWGNRELVRRVRAAAYRIDAAGALARARAAESERRVSIRPKPDVMCQLTALVPMAQGVAAYAVLSRDADSARAGGDPRTRGQVMADTLVERVTGQASAAAVPVEVQVVISDAALLGTGTGADDPGQVPGYGTVPAGWIRDLLLHDSGDGDSDADNDGGAAERARARVWLRRLYATPDSSTLVAMETGRRRFDAGLRRFLLARDGTCRTPWCDAPIRHLDHVRDHTRGGPTSEHNGQGLRERCNHTKTLPGWRVDVLSPPGSSGVRAGPHQVRWTTPLGLTYDSAAPPLLPGTTAGRELSAIEVYLTRALAA